MTNSTTKALFETTEFLNLEKAYDPTRDDSETGFQTEAAKKAFRSILIQARLGNLTYFQAKRMIDEVKRRKKI
jgi:hypothetical protein